MAEDWAPDALAVGSKAAYLWCAGGVLESRLLEEFSRPTTDAATTRNWGAVLKLQAAAGEGRKRPDKALQADDRSAQDVVNPQSGLCSACGGTSTTAQYATALDAFWRPVFLQVVVLGHRRFVGWNAHPRQLR